MYLGATCPFSVETVYSGTFVASKCVSESHDYVLLIFKSYLTDKRWKNKPYTQYTRVHCKPCFIDVGHLLPSYLANYDKKKVKNCYVSKKTLFYATTDHRRVWNKYEYIWVDYLCFYWVKWSVMNKNDEKQSFWYHVISSWSIICIYHWSNSAILIKVPSNFVKRPFFRTSGPHLTAPSHSAEDG